MRVGRSGGSILIVSLWVLATLFLSAMSLAVYTSVYLRASSKAFETVRAEAAYLCSVNWMANTFNMSPADKTPKDSWAGNVKVPSAWKNDLKIVSIDEESKLNLNRASGPQLLFLFSELSKERIISLDPKKTVEGLIEYRAHKPFEVLEEMLLLKGVLSKDVEGLKPYLTVYTADLRVNINTASDHVLQTLVMNLSAEDESLKTSIDAALGRVRASDNYFNSDDMTPEAFMNKTGLEHTPQMNEAAAELLNLLTTRSHFLRLNVSYKGRNKAEIVIAPDKMPGGNAEILFWHEGRAAYAA